MDKEKKEEILREAHERAKGGCHQKGKVNSEDSGRSQFSLLCVRSFLLVCWF